MGNNRQTDCYQLRPLIFTMGPRVVPDYHSETVYLSGPQAAATGKESTKFSRCLASPTLPPTTALPQIFRI